MGCFWAPASNPPFHVQHHIVVHLLLHFTLPSAINMVVRCGQINNRQANAAFTLVEIVVAAGLLGIMMAAFFACLGSGIAIVNNARQELRATQILTQKAEAIRLCTWSELHSLPASFQEYYNSSGITNDTTGITYYGTISVGPATCIPSSVSYYDDINLVTVNLVWTNYVGAHPIVHKRQMQTLAAYHGLVWYLYGSDFLQQ